MKCSKCGSEMKQEPIRVVNERTLLPEIMLLRQYACLNKQCERFSQPLTRRPLPPPRFTRGRDHLSETERARLDKLTKVAMAPGLENTSLKVVDAITTYLLAGQPALMMINGGAESEVVRVHAGEALRKMAEESRGRIVTVGPKDIVVMDRRGGKFDLLFKKPKNEWTPEDELKYVPPNYSVDRGKDYTPQWLAERLRGDDLQAELLRLFRDHPRTPIHDGPLLGWRSLKDTAEEIARRLGRDQSEVRRELDGLLERGILYKTEKMEYFSICEFPPNYPACRICHQPMKLLDEEKQQWYCYHDDQVWYGKEQRWQGPTQDTLRLARLPPRIVQISPRLLRQLAPDSQREIELTCLRLLQQVAIESEFEITSLKVIEAIETLEAAAVPALVEITNRAAKQAVKNYAYDTIVRIMESRKEPKHDVPEHPVSVNCPNCSGEMASGEASTCDYCGVELARGERGFLPRNIIRCAKCGSLMGGNAWFCVNCQEILADDATPLKQLQKKLLLQQENHRQFIRQKMPEIAQDLESDEFIYSVYYRKFGRSRSFEVVTDRKLVHYASSRDSLREIPWSEFVRVVTPLAKKLPYDLLQRTALYILPVQTLRDDLMITFQVVKHGFLVQGDWEGCLNLYRGVKVAQSDYSAQRRNIKATVCSLKV